MIITRLKASAGPLALASKLLGSSVVAQITVLAATAVTTTRLHPLDFAVYGAVNGATALSASINTLASETRSPVVPHERFDALLRAGWTSILVATTLTFVVGLSTVATRPWLGTVLLLTAGTAALVGGQQLLTGVVLRRQVQRILARGRMVQGLTNAVMLLVLLWLGLPGYLVLSGSWLISMALGDLVLYLGAARGHVPRGLARRDDWRTLRAEVGAQPVASLLAGAVAAMPQVLLPALGQTLVAGTWTLVNRFLTPLVNTAYATLQPLYYGRAAEHVRGNDLLAMRAFHARWMRWLLLAGFPVLLGCAVIARYLLPLLGEQWSVGWWPTVAGAIYFASLFTCLPLSQTLQLLGEVRLAVAWTVVRFVVCGTPLLFVGPLGGDIALFTWALGGAATYFWQLWLQLRVLHRLPLTSHTVILQEMP